jgi:hypothetical protein
MSGGHWDYLQYRLNDVAQDIKEEVAKSGRKKTREELKEQNWRDPSWYEKYPEDLYHYQYPDEVLEQFKIAARKIEEAQIYMQRVDYLLSADDGDDSFIERLKEDLEDLNKKYEKT